MTDPQEGFFFGSTDYDEDYFGDLRITKEILEQALEGDADEGMFFMKGISRKKARL